MAAVYSQPCDDAALRRGPEADAVCDARPWVLAAAILGSAMAFIDGAVVNVALPIIQTSLDASSTQLQWIVESYALLLAALLLLGGAVGDHYGRRLAFVGGALGFAIASLACGFALTADQLILARAAQGAAAAFLVPGSLALIAASFPKEERGRAVGIWSGSTALAMALGPVAGGWLADNWSWRWIFFLNAPVAAAVIAISLARAPESRSAEREGPLDWPGAALATAGLGALIFGLIEMSSSGLEHASAPIALGAGVAGLAAFVWRQRNAPNAMTPPALFASRAFSGVNAMTFLIYTALSGVLFFLPLLLINIWGWSATAAAASFLPFVVMMSLFSGWAGRLTDRAGPRILLTLGPLATAAGFALFALLPVDGSYWRSVLPAILIMSGGMVLTVAPLTATVMSAVPEARIGVASGVNNAVSRTAALIAIAVFALLFSLVADANLARALAGEAALAREDVGFVFGALTVPDDAPDAAAAAARAAASEAFIAGFRVVALVAAGLAATASAVAWWSLAPARS
ncbi:MAG: MFS transporter [Caulobacterales bacterium]|nr:MFS transporter [Caulobacterales bacterium]